MTIFSKRYKWVVFDADDTLFSFNSYDGLIHLFTKLNLPFTNNDYEEYQNKNKKLWDDFRSNQITLTELGVKRFENFEQRTEKSAELLNTLFLTSMGQVSEPLEDALDLIFNLKEKGYRLALMTNGFRLFQDIRMEKFKIGDCFDSIVTSEEVGSGKPGLKIFEEFFKQANNPKKEDVLIVGDDYRADITGGINAGIDTCWLNASSVTLDDNRSTYTIKSLKELFGILN